MRRRDIRISIVMWKEERSDCRNQQAGEPTDVGDVARMENREVLFGSCAELSLANKVR